MPDLPLIDDDGLLQYRRLPIGAAGDRAARTEHALSVLVTLAAVVRPIAVQIGYCYREENLQKSLTMEPDPPHRVLVEERAIDRVSLNQSLGPYVPPTVVRELSPETLRQYLLPPDPAEVPAGLAWDWLVIESIATAARVLSGQRELRFANLKQTIEPYDGDWFAGPPGKAGWERLAPVDLELMTTYQGIGLTTAVHWPPWFDPETPEGKLWLETHGSLEPRGWRRPIR